MDDELDRIVSREIDRVEGALGSRVPQKESVATEAAHERHVVVEMPRRVKPLAPEAEKFVAETSAWLREREDRDLILSRIKARLTEPPADPGAGEGYPDGEASSGSATEDATGSETELDG